MKSITELMALKGRFALVTGATGHIGSAMADALAEAGCGIAVLDLDQARCEAEAARLSREHGVTALPVAADLSREDASGMTAEAAVEAVAKTLGRLDILVNCAAFVGTTRLEGWVTDFEHQSAETWRKALEVNLTAPFRLCRAAAPLLRASGHGAIVNVASTYGVAGPDLRLYEGIENMGNPAAYAASKGGLLQFTRWLATVLAPEVRVNAISPGGLARGQDARFIDRYQERTPLRRMGTEEDMKGAVLYLASDLSAYVTGQNLLVDGGWTVW